MTSSSLTGESKKRVLILCPRFAPSNAPDSHRVRIALPWLRQFGWDPTVLAVEPQYIPVPQDPLLSAGIPSDIRIVRTKAISLKFSRPFGVGSLAIRSMLNLQKKGDELIKEGNFDVVYISTTEFGLFGLGPRWLRKFGVPYVLDYQDPWLTDYYRKNKISPPGGYIKHRLCQGIGRLLEPSIVKKSSHITVVSSRYMEQLRERYHIDEGRFTVLPFGGAAADFDVLQDHVVKNEIFQQRDGFLHWVFAGVAGPYMRRSVSALFTAFRRALDETPDQAQRVKMHFIGTDYAVGPLAKERILPIAREFGVGDYVSEKKERIPYFQVLRCLLDADALIVPGSDDAGYTASKLYPYILAKKPMLTIFHDKSSVGSIVRDCKAGVSITFSDTSSLEQISSAIYHQWFVDRAYAKSPSTDWTAFEPYTAKNMTQALCKIFAKTATTCTHHQGRCHKDGDCCNTPRAT